METSFDYKIDLTGKHLLIIMPKFYAYQTKMREDLEARGAIPHFFDEEPDKTKFLILKNLESIFKIKNIFDGFNKDLLTRIVKEKPAEGYDFLLIIRGNVLTPGFVDFLKSNCLKPGAGTMYYSWDSFANLRHKGDLGVNFDRRATFDSVDAAQSKLGYELLPLFYSDEFDGAKIGEPAEYKYDYVSVSAFFPFRYRYFKAFAKANPDKRLCLKIYLDPKVYRGKKLKDPKLVKNLDMEIISFDPFTPDQIRDMVKDSRAVLDLAHEAQQGLTMRTMETLGIKRKLVTNNKYIKDYDFYNNDNVIVLENLSKACDEAEATGDYSAFKLPGAQWLEKPYVENEALRAKHSIHAWLDALFADCK